MVMLTAIQLQILIPRVKRLKVLMLPALGAGIPKFGLRSGSVANP